MEGIDSIFLLFFIRLFLFFFFLMQNEKKGKKGKKEVSIAQNISTISRPSRNADAKYAPPFASRMRYRMFRTPCKIFEIVCNPFFSFAAENSKNRVV